MYAYSNTFNYSNSFQETLNHRERYCRRNLTSRAGTSRPLSTRCWRTTMICSRCGRLQRLHSRASSQRGWRGRRYQRFSRRYGGRLRWSVARGWTEKGSSPRRLPCARRRIWTLWIRLLLTGIPRWLFCLELSRGSDEFPATDVRGFPDSIQVVSLFDLYCVV